MSDLTFSNIDFLRNRIVETKNRIRQYDEEFRNDPECRYGLMPGYTTLQRHLEELQEKLTEAKQEKLAAVG